MNITYYAADLMGVPGLDSSLKTQSVDAIIAGWQSRLAQFRALRRNYLLYPEPGPSFASARLAGPNGGGVELSWSGLLGRSYRLWSQDQLAGAWNSLGDYPGTGSTVTATLTPTLAHRFYRLELLP